MKKFILLLMAIIFLLPQCTKIEKKKTFTSIQDESKKRINVSPEWVDSEHKYPFSTIAEENMSIDDAVALGLRYNPGLQAQFEKIGIRKSDLVQAGFYTNPYVASIFRIPTKKGASQTNIEFSANFTLSDLWQVPLRKKVAQRNLEITTHQIMGEILQLRKQIQLAYLNCLYQKEYLILIKKITSVIQQIKDRIDYSHQFGYNSDLDKYVALSKLAQWYAMSIDAQAQLDTAYTSFYQILGLPISSKKVSLASGLNVVPLDLQTHELEQFALSSHPDILIEQSTIAKARAEIRYEKSRVVDKVELGIAYVRDFEKGKSGVGPLVGINVPLFNTNFGNIERAKFEMSQAEKKLRARKRIIFQQLSNQSTRYNSYIKQIEQYNEQVIPPVIKALEFSKEFFDKMQMSMIVFLQTQIDLWQSKIKLLELTYKAAQEYVELEFSVGARLQNINSSS